MTINPELKALGMEDIARQLRLGEDSLWEFKAIQFAGDKPKSPRRDDLADEIAAFANADGGFLLCGVTDAGEVPGMSRPQLDAVETMVVEISQESIKPPLAIKTLRRATDAEKAFLLVHIPAGEALHKSPGGEYRRVGSRKQKMSSDEAMRLAQRRGQARFLWFDKQPIASTGFATLEERSWKRLLGAEGAIDPERGLKKIGLLTTDNSNTPRATVAGVLLCNAEPQQWLPSATITATHYRGTDRASGQLDSQDITGPIDDQIRAAFHFVVRNMRVGAHKDPARVNLPQYDKLVLFEVLVNAIVHRDYSIQGSRIRLAMFSDRIEVNSPGDLPNTMTVESMDARQATRNEVLTSVFSRMPTEGFDDDIARSRQFFMERRGDGVPIIKKNTEELCGIPATFELLDGGAELRVTIPAAKTEIEPASAQIVLMRGGQPMANADVLVLFPNKTFKQATSDDRGEANFELHTTHLPMTVFAAAEGCKPFLKKGWIPEQGNLTVSMQSQASGGSIIFPQGTGCIPGLSGRLNPIRDNLDRTYLYADNIAINKGMQQPVHFGFNENLLLIDADGHNMSVCIVNIVGRSALLGYSHSE